MESRPVVPDKRFTSLQILYQTDVTQHTLRLLVLLHLDPATQNDLVDLLKLELIYVIQTLLFLPVQVNSEPELLFRFEIYQQQVPLLVFRVELKVLLNDYLVIQIRTKHD